MVSRWELVGIVEKPPVSVAVIPTNTYDFDTEVPSALASINMAVEAGSKRSVRKSGKTFVEFYATEQPVQESVSDDQGST